MMISREAFEQEKNTEVHTQSNTGHGRIEKRTCRIIKDIDWICNSQQWEELKTLIAIESQRIDKATGKEQTETRYYISSSNVGAAFFNAARQH